jgi:hypothetical protein
MDTSQVSASISANLTETSRFPPHTTPMFWRTLIGLAIVSFWLVMTTLLVRMVYFPEESRLAREEPRLVLERFLNSGVENSMDVWKGNEVIGNLRIESKKAPATKKGRPAAPYVLHSQGKLKILFPGQPTRWLQLLSQLYMDLDGNTPRSFMQLNLDNPGLSFSVNNPVAPEPPTFLLKQGDSVLLSSTELGTNDKGMEGMLQLMLGSLGINSSDMQKQAKEIEGSETTARRGKFTILDRNFIGFILTTTLGGNDRKFTLYLSETGELLQMKTSFLDYVFINDEMRPENPLADKEFPRALKETPE